MKGHHTADMADEQKPGAQNADVASKGRSTRCEEDCATGAGPAQRVPDTLAAALEAVAARAGAADAGEATLEADVKLLLAAGGAQLAIIYGGLMSAHTDKRTVPVSKGAEDAAPKANIDAVFDFLRQVGRANLSLGRLLEGHFNAVRLIGLYGTAAQRASAFLAAQRHGLFGVWGADAAAPVRLVRTAADSYRLTGGKRFASGLGSVGCAVVTARDEDEALQLLMIDVDDADRGDPSAWQTDGMRATLSGDYDFTGLSITEDALLGPPGAYLQEPHFEGGVWRYVAVQLGGLEALCEAARQHVRVKPGLAGSVLNQARVAQIAIACENARLWSRQAAQLVERADAGEAAVAYGLLARESFEQNAVQAMAIADRLTGTASHFSGHPIERIRRDLGFFLRQANLDGKLEKAARHVIETPTAMGEQW
ncbi:hypothetical protein [Pseudohoeflea coraliihabitans]|uniref:Acyl-CoA dehydrogenase n=1 Tax=Pseudohoeflea coraliihabitans TaxID=2860393 RepID=A0ABS6WKE9_9HYPH|nr:hypothetical protein [Pseudohoeflea sp. DP4N28-3]MBW3096409.1 hypothetical protein [Pseudohoeflea sp. DP4N28-3]